MRREAAGHPPAAVDEYCHGMRSVAFGYCDVGEQSAAQFHVFMQCADDREAVIEAHLDAEFLEVFTKPGDVVARTTSEIVPLFNNASFQFGEHS